MIITDILQPTHLLLILAAALLVLGPKRLPEAARTIGRGLHDLRSAVDGERDALRRHVGLGEPTQTPATAKSEPRS